jgi:pimeloyl-ACP methyl ester carboxylesterase
MIDQESSMTVNGVSLAYEVSGAGTPVLLIHGLGGGRNDWQPQIPALDGFRVIRFDLRGHGASEKPAGEYSLSSLGDDAAELIRALAAGPAHVVGLSLGGMVAFQLAVDWPELVRSLTIVNSGPEVIPKTAKERVTLGVRLGLTWALGPRWLGKLLARRLFPKREQKPLRDRFTAQMATNDRRAYLATTRAILGWSVAQRIEEITCPVLVVSGDRDYTPVERKMEYVRRLRDAELVVIPDSGHATPMDRWREFNDQLLRFLRAQGRVTS